MKSFLLIPFILFSCLYSIAQSTQKGSLLKKHGIELTLHRGFLMQHRKNFEPLVKDHISGFGISLETQTIGKNQWENNYGLPLWGISLEYFSLGNPEQLGNVICTYPYLKLYFINKKRISLSSRLGWGAGYITKVWDNEVNFKNNLISSHLNICASIGSDLSYSILPTLKMSTGIRFTHFSNGAVKYPNLGVNIVSGYASLSYRFSDTYKNEIETKSLESSEWKLVLLFNGFRKGESAGIDKYYSVLNSSLSIHKKSNQKLFFQGGIDVFYDTWLEYYFEREHINYSPNKDYWLSGVFGSVGLQFGKLQSMLSLGAYVFGKEFPSGNLYNRLTTQYMITPKWMGSFSIKAHYFEADYFELGIGRILWQK